MGRGQATALSIVYYSCMVDQLRVAPPGAEQFRTPGNRLRKLGTFVLRNEADPTGSVARKTLVFVSHQEAEGRQDPAMKGINALGGSAEVQGVPQPEPERFHDQEFFDPMQPAQREPYGTTR